jgi:hypothetical protein
MQAGALLVWVGQDHGPMIVSIANVIVSATFLSIGVWMLRRTHASRANLAADTSTADAARRMVTVLQVCVQHINYTNREMFCMPPLFFVLL